MKNFHGMKTARPSYIIVTYTTKKINYPMDRGNMLQIALVHALRASAILLFLKNFLEHINTKLYSKLSHYLI